MHGNFDTPLTTSGSRALHVTGPIKWEGDAARDRPARRIRIQTISIVQGQTDSAIAGHDRPNLTIDRPAGNPTTGDWEFDLDTDDGRAWVPGPAFASAVVRITTQGTGIRGSNEWDEPWNEPIWLQ